MRSELFTGRYVFHFHTVHTDGRDEIEDYFACAVAHRMERLIFLEHIRRVPSYDVAAYARRVRAAADRYRLPAHLGFEAKLLPDGGLDISPEHAALAEVIGLAEHGFPADAALLEGALRTAAATWRDRYPNHELVWAHPGLWFKKHGRLDQLRGVYLELLDHAQRQGLRVERNRRYGLVPEDVLAAIAPDRLVHGLDAHSVGEMARGLDSPEPRRARGGLLL